MKIDLVHEVLNQVLGNTLNDYNDGGEPRIDRAFVADILMDYLHNNRDRQFVINALMPVIGEKLSVLELCAMLEEIDLLKEGPRE